MAHHIKHADLENVPQLRPRHTHEALGQHPLPQQRAPRAEVAVQMHKHKLHERQRHRVRKHRRRPHLLPRRSPPRQQILARIRGERRARVPQHTQQQQQRQGRRTLTRIKLHARPALLRSRARHRDQAPYVDARPAVSLQGYAYLIYRPPATHATRPRRGRLGLVPARRAVRPATYARRRLDRIEARIHHAQIRAG